MTSPSRLSKPLAAAVAIAALALPAAAEAAAPTNVTPPSITGTPRVGQSLAASQGEWTGAPTAYFYSWLRCEPGGPGCAPVPGATGPTYTIAAADEGSRLRVEVVAANADGASPAARSAATRVIRVPVPTVVAKPSITGAAREGSTLTASTGEWTGAPTSFVFDWRRCSPGAPSCADIPGANEQTLLLGPADVGSTIRVRVRARNAGGLSVSAGSPTTPRVESATAGFRLGQVHRDRRRGLARVEVSVPGPGALTLARTAKVKGEKRTVSTARTVKLTVRPRRRAKARLQRRGRNRVRVAVTFQPAAAGAAARTKDRRIVLRHR